MPNPSTHICMVCTVYMYVHVWTKARPPLVVAGSSEAFVWVQQARCLGLMNLGDASQKPHLDRRRAAVGKAFKDLQPALRHPGSMRLRALLYRVYVVPALLYALPEASGLTD